jgi:hypothetical protein
MKPLNRILVILIFFFVSQAAKADLVTLKNLAGVEIRAEILSLNMDQYFWRRPVDCMGGYIVQIDFPRPEAFFQFSNGNWHLGLPFLCPTCW